MTEGTNITVIFADKSSKIYNTELSKQTVYMFKKCVALSLGIDEEKYFGFYFQDDQKNNYWLSDDKYLLNYDKCAIDLSLRHVYQFDYWTANQITRHLFYHELKLQLYNGDIQCNSSSQCFQLLAMTLRLDDEDHDNEDDEATGGGAGDRSRKLKSYEEIQKMNIISAQLFAKHPSINYCIEQILLNYKDLETISKEEIMKRFIVGVLEIPFQLTHYFCAKNFSSSTVTIGINNNGFSESDKSNRFISKLKYAWPEINHITFHKSRVHIDIQDLTNKSSFRRKSSALSISYDLPNINLAQSFVNLAKDIINFISQNHESMKIMNQSRLNPNNIKKIQVIANYGKQQFEKTNSFCQNNCVQEQDSMMSRSSSKLSLTSSNYAGSAITNDSHSLMIEDDLLIVPVNVPEKQQLFLVLNEKRKNLLAVLSEKVKEAVQNCVLEKNITQKMPADYAKLDPKSQIKLTEFSIKTQYTGGEMSTYQKNKTSLMEEIETLQNIIGKLKENEKKHKAEIKQKLIEIKSCTNRLQILEEEHNKEVVAMGTSRSSSEGCLLAYPNGNVTISNGHNTMTYENVIAPLTEPRSRKNATIFHEDSTSSGTLKYPRMKSAERKCNFTPTSPFLSPCRPSAVKNNYHLSDTHIQFQRFASGRNQIKGLPSKFQFHLIPTNTSNSNSSVESTYSFDVQPEKMYPRSSNSNTDSETSEDHIVVFRIDSNNSLNHGALNSREASTNFVKINYKPSNIKMARNKSLSINCQIRNSASFEDVREESSETPTFFSERCRKDSCESTSSFSKLTYHLSKKDHVPTNLTRGKQPSIIRKAATKPNLIEEKS